jgi:hypothetical protein
MTQRVGRALIRDRILHCPGFLFPLAVPGRKLLNQNKAASTKVRS